MSSTYRASEVLSIISDWDESENDDDEEFEDLFTSDMQVDSLDIAQSITYPYVDVAHSSEDEDSNSDMECSPTQNISSAFNPQPFVQNSGPLSSLSSTASPLDFFKLLFDNNVLSLIVQETNQYASQNPPGTRYCWFDTCDAEMKSFLGIIIAMGIHRLPQLEDYWADDPLLGVPGIVQNAN